MRTPWHYVALFVVATLTTGCEEETAAQKQIRPVRTVVIDPKPIPDDRQAIGEVKPRYESNLGFRVAGKLISRLVDIGVTVKKGDLLARLDKQDFNNNIRAAMADEASASAILEEAVSAEKRAKTLLAKRVVSQSNYDAALRKLRTARATLAAARAALALAKDQLAYTELRADFDGIVTGVSAEPGQVVAVGQTVVTIAKPQAKDAVFNIAEAALRDRKPDERPKIVVNLLSAPNITADGVVREVSPVADATTRTYKVKVTLNNPPPQMRFGATVLGRLKTETAPVVVLPGSALFDKDGKPAVWIYDPATSQVRLKAITVTRFEPERIIVLDGLKKGDIVVTAGVNRLREGQKVRLLPLAHKSAKATSGAGTSAAEAATAATAGTATAVAEAVAEAEAATAVTASVGAAT